MLDVTLGSTLWSGRRVEDLMKWSFLSVHGPLILDEAMLIYCTRPQCPPSIITIPQTDEGHCA